MPQTKQRHKEYMKDWNKAHKESVRKTAFKIKSNRRELILTAKKKPCMDCLKEFNSWQMQFDHRNPKRKKFHISGAWTRSVKDLQKEILKCDVVCANYHANRKYKQGHKAQRTVN